MRPWSDDGLARGAQPLHQARHGIRIGIVPAADHQGWRLDGGEVFAHRTVFPIGVAMRMLQPVDGEEGLVLEPLHPHLAPLVANDGGVWRTRRIGQHGGGPAQHLVEHRAALIMDVILVAVIGGTDGDDGLECRRLPRRHLQRVEAAPGNAEHAELSRAPRLPGDPGDDFKRVVLLLFGIFIEHYAIAVARASHINADRCVAVTREVRMRQGIAHMRAVALAIRQVLEEGRYRVLLRIPRNPHAGGEFHAVRHRDPEILDFLHLAGKVLDGGDGHVSPLGEVCRDAPAGRLWR